MTSSSQASTSDVGSIQSIGSTAVSVRAMKPSTGWRDASQIPMRRNPPTHVTTHGTAGAACARAMALVPTGQLAVVLGIACHVACHAAIDTPLSWHRSGWCCVCYIVTCDTQQCVPLLHTCMCADRQCTPHGSKVLRQCRATHTRAAAAAAQEMEMSSTSNTSVALGGMTPPAPRLP